VFLINITYISYILTIIVFLLFVNNNRNTRAIIIIAYTSYSFINDVIIEKKLLTGIVTDSSLLMSIFTIVEFLFLFIYLSLILVHKRIKIFLYACSLFFFVVAFLNIYENLIQNSPSLDTIPIAVSSIILIIGSLVYFFETIQTPEVSFIYSKPSFWVVVGIMIYFSGTFFLFLQYENLSDTDKKTFWIINMFCLILKNIFFSISFILKPENQQISNVDDYYLNKIE